ncbi:MAG: DUF1343 domain-containing protein [Candidatus Hydrogenedentes bacterium]|nr:DUF1343 domain-containing protein [Candidatus Hydrogenedentota bacterium]
MPNTVAIDPIRAALRKAVKESGSPGAVLYIGDLERDYLQIAHGDRQRIPSRKSVRNDTLYDLASLTKVVATATAVMMLRDEGAFRLDQSITDFVPIPAFREMRIFDLLTHTSGLVPVERYFETMDSLDEMLQRYAEEGIENPPGVMHSYSDVGFMLLGRLVEIVAQDSLDAFCRKRIFEPLGMTRTAFNPPVEWSANCAATEDDPWRGRIVLGEVHDENTYAVGGVSGQAGLFSTTADLARFCRAFLRGDLLKRSTVDEMTRFGSVPLYPWQGLAWQIDPWSSKKTGFLPSRNAFGHAGWTGTSLWMDRATGLFVILLSNTIHPSREVRDNETLRRIVHTAIGDTFYRTVNAHSGLDRLVRENFTVLEDKRIALLTNHAAVDQLGRHIFQLLPFALNTELRLVYSPEHGIQGQAEAGETVEGQRGPVSVISLYGDRKTPSQEELSRVDLFIVDLQDIGSRYYTYMATMRQCMAACAKAKVPVLVLDRPNPLGGQVLEGPIAVDTSSLVSNTAIPVRHGMTMGELATWYTQTDLKNRHVDLTVNLLDNWQPRRFFHECNLPWVPPSPNIPTPETALLYAGMCLFEATNLNEGRGTDTPFALIGAPWLDASGVIGAVKRQESAGCELHDVTYTPRSIPGKASDPRYRDHLCHGIRIEVTDFDRFRPFTLAVALLIVIRKRHPSHFAWSGSPEIDVLAGGPDLRSRIERGHSARRIIARYRAQLNEFDAIRPRLYDENGISTANEDDKN